MWGFSVLKLFFLQFSATMHISEVNCTDVGSQIDLDKLRTENANAVAHLMSFAQITC